MPGQWAASEDQVQSEWFQGTVLLLLSEKIREQETYRFSPEIHNAWSSDISGTSSLNIRNIWKNTCHVIH